MSPADDERDAPRQYVELASVDTWAELQAAMTELGASAPYWRTMGTDGTRTPPDDDGWYADWDEQFRLEAYKHLQWCELHPRTDGSGPGLADLAEACAALGFEVEPGPDRIRLLGYRRLS